MCLKCFSKVARAAAAASVSAIQTHNYNRNRFFCCGCCCLWNILSRSVGRSVGRSRSVARIMCANQRFNNNNSTEAYIYFANNMIEIVAALICEFFAKNKRKQIETPTSPNNEKVQV